ncbi:uncharacterized protein FIBRA_02104 [Fibroporia radiculosa]|uniref:Uncharacterized protein n=1 Tax=Fibroporia radiculosa TaxID=599839 RepID=J4HUD3_9APHY|nr:uncharacterized protein FIBRA_02104 [Fibroporia radiculosa]CCM00077.1 predicted protein [Fibroporia radiculosa]
MDDDKPLVPPELWDDIIDCLWNDRPALLACTLTCRAWLPRARFHAFHSISVVDLSSFKRLHRLLDASPHLASYVRRLSIVGGWTQGLPTSTTRVDKKWPALLSRLPLVEDLTLCRWNAAKMKHGALRALYKSLEAIRTLRLVDVQFQRGTEDVPWLVLACPRLTALHCCDLDMILYPQPSPPRSLPPRKDEDFLASTVRLESLKLSETDPAIRAWLLNSPVICQVQRLSLDVSCTSVVDVGGQDVFLRQAGPALRDLVISFSAGDSDLFLEDLDLRICTGLAHTEQLATLHIKFYNVSSMEQSQYRVLECACFVLNHITQAHRSLRQFRISFLCDDLWDCIDFGRNAWMEFDQALASVVAKRPHMQTLLEIVDDMDRWYKPEDDLEEESDYCDEDDEQFEDSDEDVNDSNEIQCNNTHGECQNQASDDEGDDEDEDDEDEDEDDKDEDDEDEDEGEDEDDEDGDGDNYWQEVHHPTILEDTPDSVLQYLPVLQQTQCCLMIAQGRQWNMDAEFGGCIIGQKSEWSFNFDCPLPQE